MAASVANGGNKSGSPAMATGVGGGGENPGCCCCSSAALLQDHREEMKLDMAFSMLLCGRFFFLQWPAVARQRSELMREIRWSYDTSTHDNHYKLLRRCET